ncbi:hypothetical protein BUALT_Bualt02G0109500 [Buddleja alternifolia]|uniref:Zinc finger BED domain-containing protein RICESLEEPER 2-like n=1 Tax=Buddleja alternifolia TaxID=168488 RepID=A0AAV6Y9X6_9LAMI|nr:hypothetical protein BUALT_Bualt02G0109500 [Buddleja alternifolia]
MENIVDTTKDVPSQEANDVEIIMEMAAPVDEQEEAQNVESGNVPQQNNLNGTNATKRSPLEVHKEPYRPPPKKIQRAKAVEVVKTEGPKNVSEIWGHFTRLKVFVQEISTQFEKAFERLGEEDHKFIDYFDDYEMNQEGECGGRRGKGKGSKIIGPPMDVDWTNARNFVKFLKIFYNVTLKFSGSSYITSNSFFRELATVHVGLSNMISKGDYQMASMALRMKEKFNKYWGNIDNINWLLFIAILLDPRYKLKYVNFGFATIYEGDGSFVKRMTGKVEDMLCLLYKHYAEPNFQQTGRDEHPKPGYNYMNVDDEDDPSELLESQFAKHLEDEECVESKSEVTGYLLDSCEKSSKDFDILNWWKKNTLKYPVLSKVARDVLAIPVSTIASKSAFSTSGRVIDPFRSSLSPKMVEALICAQNWLKSTHSPIDLRAAMEDIEQFEQFEKEFEGSSSFVSSDD